MNDYINVKKDTQVRNIINDMLDRYNRLPYICQSNLGYDSLIQNVILRELINMMATTIVDKEIELKMKVSRINCLESRLI